MPNPPELKVVMTPAQVISLIRKERITLGDTRYEPAEINICDRVPGLVEIIYRETDSSLFTTTPRSGEFLSGLPFKKAEKL